MLLQQFRKMGGGWHGMARSEEMAQVRKSSQADVGDLRAVGDQSYRPGIFKLIPDFALAIAWIQQRGNRTGEGGRVECDSVFPSVGKIDGDDLARLDAK